MGIKFANGGFITTIQDMGRTGYQEFGVPAAGVMDTLAFRKAHILVLSLIHILQGDSAGISEDHR